MNSFPSEQPERIYWTELQNNRLKKKLHPLMLRGEGLSSYRQKGLPNTLDNDDSKVLVKYDRDYIVHWLKVKFVIPLETVGIEELIELVKNAYEVKDIPISKIDKPD